MGEVLPLPSRGEVFLDPRGEGRSLRVSWHQDEHTLVLSLWQFGQCRATFRLPSDQVPELVRALVAGLSDGLAQQRPGGTPTQPVALKPPSTGGSAADGPTALVAVDPPTVPVEPATVPVDPPTAQVAPTERVAADPRKTKPAADRTIAPPAVFLAPPEQA